MLFSLSYIINFVKDKNIGSVTPTSRFGVKKILSKINFNKNLVVVEYGPGTGVITKALLAKMNKKSKLIALETNGAFYKILKKKIKDPRFYIFHDSAENVATYLEKLDLDSADAIISGIPFSMLKPSVAKKIMEKTSAAINTKGKFLAYQFISYRAVVKIAKRKKSISIYLPKYFDKVNKDREILNIPPLWIFEAANENFLIKKAKMK